MNYDNILINLFWNFENNQGSSIYRKFNQKVKKYSNIYNYLENRFNDSESIYESLQRLVFKLYERPICPICGNKLNFIGKPNGKGIFQKACSKKCSAILTNNFNKHIKESQEKTKNTKLIKYGNLNNFEKIKKTKLERYDDEYYVNKEKAEQTKLEKYNDQYFNNREKYHKTCLDKYGIKTFVNSDKCKKTKLERYGNENYNNSEQIKLTYKLKSKEEKEQLSLKVKQTKLEHYGDEKYNNIDKSKQTCLEKYGVDSYSKTNNFKQILNDNYEIIQEKRNNTKKKNNSFNKSKLEDQAYLLLKEKYSDIQRQYFSKDYPFNSDFYIPSLDLYIEYNGMWTHGFHPYDPDNIEDKNKLELWKSKQTKFYDNAIYTWTDLDIRKRNIAKQNKLNFIEFWTIDEVKEWIINQS